MRSLLLAVVLALLVSGLVPQAAQAQAFYYSYPAYGPYAPGIYYGQSLYAPPTYFEPPYLWSNRYYVNPYSRGWYSLRYYPWTDQYYYQYRTYPRWRW
jgi:hypothetical protein